MALNAYIRNEERSQIKLLASTVGNQRKKIVKILIGEVSAVENLSGERKNDEGAVF